MTLPRRLVLTAALVAAAALASGCAGGDPPRVVEGEPLPADDVIVTASTGETVILDEYLEEGVVTVVEFYADW